MSVKIIIKSMTSVINVNFEKDVGSKIENSKDFAIANDINLLRLLESTNNFIIHSSEDAKDGEVKPVHNEKLFVEKMYNMLFVKKLNPWVDFKKSFHNRKEREDARINCHFAIVVCSPKYLDHNKDNTEIAEEISHFRDKQNILKYNPFIPIKFNLSAKQFLKTGFTYGKNVIEIDYPNNKDRVDFMADLAVQKIREHIIAEIKKRGDIPSLD